MLDNCIKITFKDLPNKPTKKEMPSITLRLRFRDTLIGRKFKPSLPL